MATATLTTDPVLDPALATTDPVLATTDPVLAPTDPVLSPVITPIVDPSTMPMDWSSTPHLLQAMLVAVCVLMLVMGYNAGRRM